MSSIECVWVYNNSMHDSKNAHGVIEHTYIEGRTDYLFRISLKALVFNDYDEVLLVKETGKDFWDIPGGGMDHSESIKDTLRRELEEEVTLTGDFEYQVISTEAPTYINTINIWQMRIIFAVWPKNTDFSAGIDGDEIKFATVESLKLSDIANERIFGDHGERARKIRP